MHLNESGCPRSLQVATFLKMKIGIRVPVRLPPQSPSRYIRAGQVDALEVRPVAPAVSKSLHSHRKRTGPRRRSGCPRSLQVATFLHGVEVGLRKVRLPPQSPSRYIRSGLAPDPGASPVAPAVSKSLHSPAHPHPQRRPSGCPRSLQVATFKAGSQRPLSTVRLPPQSPSRYIPYLQVGGWASCPVAPAVSKSLHSSCRCYHHRHTSGCPRSLQVATFVQGCVPGPVAVRLPPQSPSRYIRRRDPHPRRRCPVAPAVSKSLHSPVFA